MKLLAAFAAAALLASPSTTPAQNAARYLDGRESAAGGFAEPGAAVTPGLSAWVAIGLRASGRSTADLERLRAYLVSTEAGLASATDMELALVARASLGDPAPALVERVRSLKRRNGAIGPSINSTIWGVLALRAVGEPAPPEAIRLLLARQQASGGWAWTAGAAPDSNDTAAAIQALRAAGVRGRPIARGLAFLRRHQRPDGGFELSRGRGSDVQSTSWAIQAFVAARERAPTAAVRYLLRMQRPDGSFRYSARYAVTPVWVTAQALAALARKPLPLR